jgi:hypothetical protein
MNFGGVEIHCLIFLRKSKIGESLKQLDTRSNEANFLLPIELAVRAI